MTPEEKKLIKARKLVAAVNRLAKKQGLNFFIVTDGASGISNNGNPAVRNAREAQIKWELEHGADPYEDWSKKASSLDLKKLFPNSKFPTKDELKEKEKSFSVGDRVKVSDHIRCRQKGHVGTIVRIDPENKHGWKSFIVEFDDKKYGSMGFSSGNIDKVVEKNAQAITPEEIETMARPHYADSGSHGWNHIQDVLASARRMRRKELLKKELAALMYHDSSLLTGPRETHAEDSADIAKKELAGKFSRRQLADIVNAIAHHRASYDGNRKSKLENLVAAADRDVFVDGNIDDYILRSYRYGLEHGMTPDEAVDNTLHHMPDKYGTNGYAYANIPKIYMDTYGDEVMKAQKAFDSLTADRIRKILKNASSKNETYESGEGEVESYTPDKTEGHDEIVLRLKNGKKIVISNNTRLGIRVIPAAGDRMGYNGYRINGTNVVHKVHGNKHQRGGWLEHAMGKSAQENNESVFSADFKTFKLKPGQSIGHVVAEWNKLHPDNKVTVNDVVYVNGGIPASRYLSGKKYKFPSADDVADRRSSNTEQTGSSTTKEQSVVDRISNIIRKRTPVGTFINDVARANTNKAARGAGLIPDDMSIVQGPIVDRLSDDQEDWLRLAIQAKYGGKVPEKGGFGGVRVEGTSKYQDDYLTYVHPGFKYSFFPSSEKEGPWYDPSSWSITNKLRDVNWRNTGVPNSIEYMLGDFSFGTDENGNIIVQDTYDFNEGEGQGGNGHYKGIRGWAGRHASSNKEPDSQKIRFKVNLGNPKDWAKFDAKKFHAFNEPYRKEFPKAFYYNDEVPEEKPRSRIPLYAGVGGAATIAAILAASYKDSKADAEKKLVDSGVVAGSPAFEKAMKKWRRNKLLKSVAAVLAGGAASGSVAKAVSGLRSK